MAAPAPRVFTIAPSAPFLPTLIAALTGGALIPGVAASDDPLALSRATLYLPTRRACRLARDIFLDTLKADAAILPRILPIGDVDEDELAFAEVTSGATAEEALALPPALDGFPRRMLLAQLVHKWARAADVRGAQGAPLVAYSPASALALTDKLARLIDDMTTRKVPWERLDDLVPDDFDPYWQLTLEFLKIARHVWPGILAERGLIEPADRRDRLIAAEAKRLAANEDGPVIAAGSTGSMPATASLLATIARLPHGAVVLPGLDTALADSSWELIGGKAGDDGSPPAIGHPQFAMHALLKRIGIGRGEVAVLGASASPAREKLASEALCPASASECWSERLPADTVSAALSGVTVIETANAEEESLAIAVALREAVEEPGKTAALVTPDRALARRVMAALARWNVTVDDSGGDRLADTPAGVFAKLAVEATLGGLAPASLLALLKHPLFRLGARDEGNAIAIDALERAIMRGPRPAAGTAGLRQALQVFRATRGTLHRTDMRLRLNDAQLDEAAGLVERLAIALAPLEKLGRGTSGFAGIAARHRDVIAALAEGKDGASAFTGFDGIALAQAFDDIATSADGFGIVPAEYPELFAAAIGDRVVRRPGAAGVRVRIFGLLEARLQSVDRMVLGGLVEGHWPPEAHNDAWLSRPMRQELGLDLPERRIGLTAHDFAQALGAPEVILTRATKLAGTPTLWSRFVQRIAAVAGEDEWNAALMRGARCVALARSLDHAHKHEPIAVPAPKPPVVVRPKSLSVTEIEHWLRDPYTIYAKHVLKLVPLDAIDTPPGAADRGSAIHDAIGAFTELLARENPADPGSELIRLGKDHFAALVAYPEAAAFWWPRFKRIAYWFVAWESERRAASRSIHSEIGGKYEIALANRTFTLTCRADRIERLADGRYAILDYKTGQPPSERQIRTGLSPQLTLEGAILRGGGFKDLPPGEIAEIMYVQLRGGDPPAMERPIEFKGSSPDAQAQIALARLTEIANRFAQQETPYRSLVHPMWKTRYGDYDHLARVKEWSLTAGEVDFGPPE